MDDCDGCLEGCRDGPVDGALRRSRAQAAAQDALERAAEVEERARAEIGTLTLAARLRGSVGERVLARLSGDVTLSGRVVRTGPGWTLLEEEADREAVLAHAHICVVRGLARHSRVTAGIVESRLGLRSVLRGIARDRSAVRIHLPAGLSLDATIDRVGADYLEVAAHPASEPRRRAEVRGVELVPLSAVVAVRRAG